MRTVRISAKIRPICLWRVDDARVPPGNCFAASGYNRAHPLGHRIVGIRR
jgi:hypothetical protein